MSLSGTGRYEEGKIMNGHPLWFKPAKNEDQPVLMVNNSLTGQKEEFVAMEGRKVRWYTCGPTVYDSCHMGHARAYLTFDILRRIMEDYLHFDVLYQINITDIDDKIILRARRNKLLADYKAGKPSLEDVTFKVDGFMEKKGTKLRAKLAALEVELPATATSREKAERETLLGEQRLKNAQFFDEFAVTYAQAKDSKDVEAVLAVCGAELAEGLDDLQGHLVRDHSIFDAHARKFEREYWEDMAALGVREPDVLTRVTEYVPEIIAFIEKIVEKGMAYAKNGSVYLDLEHFQVDHAYRKCAPGGDATDAELAESEGALGASTSEKKSKNDFALWKASKPGEPEWDSPWGKGRPGWHIECSVVASDILGDRLDMHSGGSDLKFPHHDNELAQSEACFGSQQWVNYFTHAGHLNIRGLKMSKSLKNFITIRQALKVNSARQLRLMFLMQAWDRPMIYGDQTVDDACVKEGIFKTFFGKVQELVREDWLAQEVGFRMAEQDHDLSEKLLDCQDKVHRGLLDNFDTPTAMNAMLDLISHCNRYLDQANCQPAVLMLQTIAVYITKILKILGVVENSTDEIGFGNAMSGGNSNQALVPVLDCFAGFRDLVRRAALQGEKKDPTILEILKLCDDVRDNGLVECGVRMEDRGGLDGKPFWMLDDPNVLKAEQSAKKAKMEEQAKAKKRNILKAKKKELDKLQMASVLPSKYFDKVHPGKFKEFDPNTLLPAKDKKTGEDLNKSQLKKLTKELAKHKKAFDNLVNKSGGEDKVNAFVQALQVEVQELEKQVC